MLLMIYDYGHIEISCAHLSQLSKSNTLFNYFLFFFFERKIEVTLLIQNIKF